MQNTNDTDLNHRFFTSQIKVNAHDMQDGMCGSCDKDFHVDNMEAIPKRTWDDGGQATLANCQVLCVACSRENAIQ